VYRYTLRNSGGTWTWTFASKFLNEVCSGEYTNYIAINGAGTEMMITNACSCSVYFYKRTSSTWSKTQTLGSACNADSATMCDNVAYIGASYATASGYTQAGNTLTSIFTHI
jgi:hypothetical protein